MDIISLGEGNSVSDCNMTIRVSVKETSLDEPPQVAVTEAEKHQLRARLWELAAEIEDLLSENRMSIFDEMAVSGITDIRALSEWRMDRQRERDERLTKRYCSEARPKIEELYEYARLRGFFHPELEQYYWTRFPFVAERLPALLRTAAESR